MLINAEGFRDQEADVPANSSFITHPMPSTCIITPRMVLRVEALTQFLQLKLSVECAVCAMCIGRVCKMVRGQPESRPSPSQIDLRN